MKRKLVYRYSCDFCGKANCSAASIAKHERGCTLNPNRTCGMCATAQLETVPRNELQTALQADIDSTKDGYADTDYRQVYPRALEEMTNCPACKLAAIRQLPLPDGVVVKFDFEAAVRCFWLDINAEQAMRDHHG